MRFSLQCEPQGLDRGGDESNENPNLRFMISVYTTPPAPASCPYNLPQHCLAARGHLAGPYYRIGAVVARVIRVINRKVFDAQSCMAELKRRLLEERNDLLRALAEIRVVLLSREFKLPLLVNVRASVLEKTSSRTLCFYG